MSEPDLSTTHQIARMAPAELTLLVQRLVADNAELREMVTARDGRIAELEAALERRQRENKRQAAPFSKGKSDDEAKTAVRKKGSGYGTKARRAAPTADPDRTVPVSLPQFCFDCGGPIDHTHTARQIVEDLPPLAVILTEFLIEIGKCRDCGHRVQPRHPDQASDALGAAAVQVGPHAKAFGCWLHYELGLSFAKCTQVLARFGIEITPSALVQACAKMSSDLASTIDAIRSEVNAATTLTADETGWRVDGESRWSWAAATDVATIYAICEGRGQGDAEAVLDLAFDGTIVADGWVVYRTAFTNAMRQSCLAHLLRRANDLEADNPTWARSTPRQVREILHRALDARGIATPEAAVLIEDLAEQIELLAGQAHPHEPNRKLVNHLAHELEDDALFTFLEQGCDATNWRGEQAMGQQEPDRCHHPRPDHERVTHRPSTRRRHGRTPHRLDRPWIL